MTAGTDEQKPVAELATLDGKPFPNENAEYRKARTLLLAGEIELGCRVNG